MHLGSAIAVLLLAGPASAGPAAVRTVTVEADRDATLIEDPAGALANGSGEGLFVGATNQTQNNRRRALLHFDIDAALPEGAVLESATLFLTMNPSNETARTLRLHRVLADWGEGASASSGGSGAPAEEGDATWKFAFYPDQRWPRPGGSFVGRASATLPVSVPGLYQFPASRRLLRDVERWRKNPSRNFGWILIGEEEVRQSSKNFASREDPDPPDRPALLLTYRLPGEETPDRTSGSR
jgi:hypothetical protein